MQEQIPLFSRPLGPDEVNETQMKRLQLSENDRAFMSRVKSQGDYKNNKSLHVLQSWGGSVFADKFK